MHMSMYICFMQRKNMNNRLNTQFWFRGRRSRSLPFSFRTAITSLYFDASKDSQSLSVLGLRNCFIDVPDYLGYSSNRTASSSLGGIMAVRRGDRSVCRLKYWRTGLCHSVGLHRTCYVSCDSPATTSLGCYSFRDSQPREDAGRGGTQNAVPLLAVFFDHSEECTCWSLSPTSARMVTLKCRISN